MVKITKTEIRSFRFALEGVKYAFKTQFNFKIQFTLGLVTVLFGFLFNFNRFEWMILLLSICLVLSAELANTVVEVVVDLVTSEIKPQAKIAKDLSAGVVLVVSVFVAIVGLFLFLPHILG